MTVETGDMEEREYEARGGRSEVGRSTAYLTCPFCGTEVKAYIWSLAGSGKRCTCGAKFNSYGTARKASTPPGSESDG